MTIDDPFKHSTFGSGVFYNDPRAALKWLGTAFGFEPSMVVSDADGRLVHAEMRFGDGTSSSIPNGPIILPVR